MKPETAVNLICLLLAPIGIFLWAQTYYQMWHWFLVPLGAPLIGMAHTYGLAMTARTVTWHIGKGDLDDDARLTNALAGSLAYPLIFLVFGWVIVHWIGI